MGAAPSVPTDAITETANATMKIFTPFYIKGYAAQLIKQLKREANPEPKVRHGGATKSRNVLPHTWWWGVAVVFVAWCVKDVPPVWVRHCVVNVC